MNNNEILKKLKYNDKKLTELKLFIKSNKNLKKIFNKNFFSEKKLSEIYNNHELAVNLAVNMADLYDDTKIDYDNLDNKLKYNEAITKEACSFLATLCLQNIDFHVPLCLAKYSHLNPYTCIN